MSLSRLSVSRPVAVSMLFVAIVLLGLISFSRLPIDLLPDVSYPRLVVYTSYPEVAPLEVERLVTELVESRVATVPQVERVNSVSRDGVSLVTVRFAWGTDMDFAMLNVREKLDNLRGALPELADRPQILRVDPESDPIMVLSVAGDDLWETKELTENVFRRRLEQLDGVAQATVAGGLDREIVVEVDPERLESYGISIQDVATAIDQANQMSTGGTILDGRTRYPLRTLGEFRQVDEIANVVVDQSAPGGDTDAAGSARTIRVRDVGVVRDGFADRQSLARYNGREAVGLMVFKESGANTVQVAEMVDEVLDVLRNEYPSVTIDVAHSQAGFIADSIQNVVSALVLGGMLAFLVLFLFLREPRYPVAVALAIPISIAAAFALMDAFGVSLNIMSLGGLALGVGMLVDNSIIVLENVFRHREEESQSSAEAAGRGAEEVTAAITASTLTTIAVFLPIVYVEGVAGELFRDLSLAVAFSLLASLLVAVTLLPVLAARFRIGIGSPTEERERPSLRPGPRPMGILRTAWWSLVVLARLPIWLIRGAVGLGGALVRFWWSGIRGGARAIFGGPLAVFDRGFTGFTRGYESLLAWSLDHRAIVLASSTVALGIAGLAGARLNRDLLPDVDQGAFEIGLELPRGASLERTAEVAVTLEDLVLADPDVEAVFETLGRDVQRFAAADDDSGLHTGRMRVRVSEGARSSVVIDRLSGILHAAVPQDVTVTVRTGQVSALGQILGGADADIAIRVQGEDLTAAFAYADRLTTRLTTVDRIDNLRLATAEGHAQFEVDILRDEVSRFGLQSQQVAQAVEQGMRGVLATEFIDFARKIPVIVRLPDELRYDVLTLERLQVRGVPLREVVRVNPVVGPAEVRREDQTRVVTLLADVRRGGLDAAIAEVDRAIVAVPPPETLQVEIGGENEEMRRSFRDLAFAFGLALLLVYMILAAQFESLLHPWTILAAVPLALIGAVLALGVASQGLNTMSLIGCVILVGIVVNDSIVKVDFIVQARTRGADLRDAIMEAGRVRLRPIVMTTVTTVLGLTPMALGIGRGADLRAPLAIAVIGGLTVATLLTLIVVPVIYSVVESLRLGIVGERAREDGVIGTSPGGDGMVPSAGPAPAPSEGLP